jgi:hypothetical protein
MPALTAAQQAQGQIGNLPWIGDLAWAGPVRVPLTQIDRSGDDPEWAVAANDPKRVAMFTSRIRTGVRPPVVLIRTPGGKQLHVADGHRRILACGKLGEPVTAVVGTAPAASGPWMSFRSHPVGLAGDADAIELTAQTAAASTVPHPFGEPSGPGLWRIKGAQLAPYIQNIARALLRAGSAKDRSQAIEMAYGLVEDWKAGRTSNGKGTVHPDVQAAATRAIAHMDALRARTHAHTSDVLSVDLAFREETAGRVPPGRPEGGQFTTRPQVLTRHATPHQTAAAINQMGAPQRAMCRRAVLPPAGYDWAPGDRLAEASSAGSSDS